MIESAKELAEEVRKVAQVTISHSKHKWAGRFRPRRMAGTKPFGPRSLLCDIVIWRGLCYDFRYIMARCRHPAPEYVGYLEREQS